jgi:hypothetical protein
MTSVDFRLFVLRMDRSLPDQVPDALFSLVALGQTLFYTMVAGF